jgi:hypothetical protein
MDREVANPNPGPVRRWAVNVPEYYEEAWFGITFSNVSYLQTFISSLAPLFSRDPKEHKSYRVSVTWHTSAVMMRTQRRKAYEMAYKRANEIAADTLSMMGHRTDSHLTVQRIANVTCAAEELEEVEDDVSLKSLLAHEPFQFTTRVNVDVEYLCHPHA